jgi:signal transduction histidine kinase/ActR/RegA family two-component response regulator
MRAWSKQPIDRPAVQGVARAAAMGVTKHELVKEAVAFLLANTQADRVGVWIESNATLATDACEAGGFRGLVADRSGEETLVEWERLSPEAPLPVELLVSGKSVEQDLDGSADRPILGSLVEMRRALWVPVESGGRLRGLLLAGMRKKGAALPRGLLEPVAADLALALELHAQRCLAQERRGDLEATRRLLTALAASGPTDAVLTSLVESCTENFGENGGLGAVFAVLRPWGREIADGSHGLEGESDEVIRQRSVPTEESDAPSWCSGDASWVSAIENAPLADIWQRAWKAHCLIGSEPGVSWPRGDVARVVAIPLEAAGETLGVLAMGFRHGATSASILQRLELRAAVAGTALLLLRRNREAAQHAAQRQALLQAGSGATILVDADGRIEASSRGAQELLGGGTLGANASADASGHSAASQSTSRSMAQFTELFCAREHECVETWLRRSRNARAISNREEEIPEMELYAGGRVRLRSAALPAGGLAVSLDPVAAPDTARADRAEAQLINVIEWLEEGVVLFDAAHGIRAMNTRFAQIAGLTPEETSRITTLNGLIARLASQAAQPEQFAKRWREQARGGDAGVREEIQLLRPVPRVLERAARPITDAAGRRLGRVEIYRDLTAQRVFQSKLLQTEKLAALGQMITGVAHELSNPLTSILGYAQRLFLRGDGAGRPDEVRQIFQEAERASTILRQLLMTARDSRPERRKVELNQVVARTMELQRYSLAAEKVRVELDLDPNLPFVLGDAGQLQQVLMNLIGNARQAIEQRGQGGTIRLSTKRIGERRALLEVSDDGPGIPEAIASRIFDPFFTTKPAGIGTGLGLAIVLGIVREHGGQVHAASPPRGGAIFSLEFPAAPPEELRLPAVPATGPGARHEFLPARQALMRAEPPAAPLSAWAGARVLVVEDEPTVARLIGDVLEDEGLLVEVLLDGREALERAACASYDLVICDMKMPGLDGQHLYKSLVSTGNPLRKKFLFVTGDVVAAQTHEFLERHHLPHVAKPFRVEELTEKCGASWRTPERERRRPHR